MCKMLNPETKIFCIFLGWFQDKYFRKCKPAAKDRDSKKALKGVLFKRNTNFKGI